MWHIYTKSATSSKIKKWHISRIGTCGTKSGTGCLYSFYSTGLALNQAVAHSVAHTEAHIVAQSAFSSQSSIPASNEYIRMKSSFIAIVILSQFIDYYVVLKGWALICGLRNIAQNFMAFDILMCCVRNAIWLSSEYWVLSCTAFYDICSSPYGLGFSICFPILWSHKTSK